MLVPIDMTVDCGTLNNPNNGEVTLTGTTVGDSATYTCNAGFRIRNSAPTVRTCQGSGQWSGDEPACEGNVYNNYLCMHKHLTCLARV